MMISASRGWLPCWRLLEAVVILSRNGMFAFSLTEQLKASPSVFPYTQLSRRHSSALRLPSNQKVSVIHHHRSPLLLFAQERPEPSGMKAEGAKHRPQASAPDALPPWIPPHSIPPRLPLPVSPATLSSDPVCPPVWAARVPRLPESPGLPRQMRKFASCSLPSLLAPTPQQKHCLGSWALTAPPPQYSPLHLAASERARGATRLLHSARDSQSPPTDGAPPHTFSGAVGRIQATICRRSDPNQVSRVHTDLNLKWKFKGSELNVVGDWAWVRKSPPRIAPQVEKASHWKLNFLVHNSESNTPCGLKTVVGILRAFSHFIPLLLKRGLPWWLSDEESTC